MSPGPRICPVLALIAGSVACTPSPPADPADLILTNGHVITIGANDRIAEAIAVRGSRIAAVGTTAEIEALAGPATERVDLAGITPYTRGTRPVARSIVTATGPRPEF